MWGGRLGVRPLGVGHLWKVRIPIPIRSRYPPGASWLTCDLPRYLMPSLLDIPPYGHEPLGDLEESMICMQDNMLNDLSVAVRLSLLLVEE